MPCNCSGPSILWKLQKLQGLHKLSLISKSGLAAYNDHVQNTSETCSFASRCDVGEVSCYACGHSASGGLRSYSSVTAQAVLAASPRKASTRPLATFASQQSTGKLQQSAVEHSVAATKASPAFLKTKNLFKDDMAYALEHSHPSSPQIAAGRHHIAEAAGQAQPSSCSSSSASTSQMPPLAWTASTSRASTVSENGSVADSASSFHGYAGVNYHPGIKDLDDAPGQWGYTLNDYKAIFGTDNYVHGCIPWEDQHIEKCSHKKFEQLHQKRVKLLQQLHLVEKDIRLLMD